MCADRGSLGYLADIWPRICIFLTEMGILLIASFPYCSPTFERMPFWGHNDAARKWPCVPIPPWTIFSSSYRFSWPQKTILSVTIVETLRILTGQIYCVEFFEASASKFECSESAVQNNASTKLLGLRGGGGGSPGVTKVFDRCATSCR